MRASFLCVVSRSIDGPACTVLARRGDCSPDPWPRSAELPGRSGFYVWDGTRDMMVYLTDPPIVPPWRGSYRPAVASDFERFGFPCPGGFAVGALRRIEAEARQGIKATIPINPARPHLLAIRAEANRGLAMEGVGVGVEVGAETGKAINELVEVIEDDGAIDID